MTDSTGGLPLTTMRADTKLSVAFDAYRRVKLLQRSPHTVSMYLTDLRRFAAFLGRDPVVGDLNNENVTGLLNSAIDAGLSIATVNKTRFNVLAFWRWLSAHRVAKNWPDIPLLVVPERVPMAWSPKEQAALFKALAAVPGKIGRVDAADWWLGVHFLILDSGERINAILKLKWDAVDLADRWVIFRAETRKGRKRDKIHRLHYETIRILKRLRAKAKGELVFEWPMSYCSLWNHYERILKKAGLPCDRRSKFHRMRRTVATFFEAAGGNATALLDHSNRKVTTAYLDPRFLKTKQACDLLPRPGKRRRA